MTDAVELLQGIVGVNVVPSAEEAQRSLHTLGRRPGLSRLFIRKIFNHLEAIVASENTNERFVSLGLKTTL